MHRVWPFPKALKAAAGPSDIEERPPSLEEGTATVKTEPGEDIEVVDLSPFPAESQRDVYDVLSEFIFKCSDADIALIHDDDVGEVMSGGIQGIRALENEMSRPGLFAVEIESSFMSGEQMNVGIIRRLNADTIPDSPDHTSHANILKPVNMPLDSEPANLTEAGVTFG